MVGVAGFEPATPCSQSRCANRTALHPEINTIIRYHYCGCKSTKRNEDHQKITTDSSGEHKKDVFLFLVIRIRQIKHSCYCMQLSMI